MYGPHENHCVTSGSDASANNASASAVTGGRSVRVGPRSSIVLIIPIVPGMADAGEPDTVSEPIDVVASAGDLDPVVVLLREFLHRSGALRAVALLPDPTAADGSPALVDCSRLAPIEVTRSGRTVHLPHSIELDAAPAGEVPNVRQLPPFDVDRE